ncbi:PEP-CTERM-box response regulator transcription factor [Thiocystis violascens]|uniref:PEP-CTERM-box response regulator transcription factor n=1 Tax=Thiocystis violascens (strain ATCC 17096 / DSM 198 / 6111) TaxID=765911 RepID=I3YGF4_THIV6|nr:PEP-CTERM-box response regulator transcription factor [Thiocystis violascens]AFL76072.1 PEP-CTERM-box response regulator transcription factor [Thiocystis violascens DSM 198]
MKEPIKRLLVVEDDPGLQSQLRWCFDGFQVLQAVDRQEALAQMHRHRPSVVTLDLGLPPDPGGVSEGLATLEEILAFIPETKVIMVTGNDDRRHAVKAISLGAYDFYLKPIDSETLNLVIERAHRLFELESENRKLQRSEFNSPLRGVIATSPEMQNACRTVEKIAATDATVLILGESGTGKELFARALHEMSSRSQGKLIAINCAAIPENLLESELFGYEKGAFTGAAKQTRGKIEYADGGTLFLDEIGDLPQALQAKLLRFLQERVIERVGGRQEIPVDLRVVCATHQDLKSRIAEGVFREDLFYRIGEVTIHLPPLREREGDALLLARVFLDKYNRQMGKSIRGFTKEALAAIEHHAWPGNVREIESLIKRAVIMAEGRQLSLEDLDLAPVDAEARLPVTLQEARARAESQAIRRTLARVNGNITLAAQELGVTRPTLYGLLEKYEIKNS